MKSIQFDYASGLLIGALSGRVTKFLSYEPEIANFMAANLHFDALSYAVIDDDDTGDSILHIKTPDGRRVEFPMKYNIGEIAEFDESVDRLCRRYRAARALTPFDTAVDIDVTKKYYLRITGVKMVRLSNMRIDDMLKCGLCRARINDKIRYLLPDYDGCSATVYMTSCQAMMALAYRVLPRSVVVENPVWMMYEFEILDEDEYLKIIADDNEKTIEDGIC
jgi:hypothetical protein